MNDKRARPLLERIGVLRQPCDLDLLLFFVRHPQVLLSSDQIAALLGYNLKQIGESLDVLLAAELLTRTENPRRAARLYAFAVGGTHDDWLPSLVELASTRGGRFAMRDALKGQKDQQAHGSAGRRDRDPGANAD